MVPVFQTRADGDFDDYLATLQLKIPVPTSSKVVPVCLKHQKLEKFLAVPNREPVTGE